MALSTLEKLQFDDYLDEFVSILEKNAFSKEEFLFNSKPYLDGFIHIFSKMNEVIGNQTIFENDINVFDLGCGTGLTSFLLAKMGYKVSAADIYDENAEIQDAFKKKEKILRNFCGAIFKKNKVI